MTTPRNAASAPAPASTGPGKGRAGRSCCGCLVLLLLFIIVLGAIGNAVAPTEADEPTPQSSPTASASAEDDEGQLDASSRTPTPRESGSPSPSPTPSARATVTPSPTPSASPTQENSTMTAVVTRVIDGDTLELADGERVRLLGIDSPERGECHFDTASARMSELVLGQSVTLTRAGEDRDRYDRLLRYVDVDGTDAGLTLIQEGLAISRYDSRDGYGYHPRQPDYVDADALTPLRTCPVEAPPVSSEAAPQAPVGENCDPNYMPCVPVYPPDINCSDITFPVRVIGSDVHRLDADGDGVGCEGNG